MLNQASHDSIIVIELTNWQANGRKDKRMEWQAQRSELQITPKFKSWCFWIQEENNNMLIVFDCAHTIAIVGVLKNEVHLCSDC